MKRKNFYKRAFKIITVAGIICLFAGCGVPASNNNDSSLIAIEPTVNPMVTLQPTTAPTESPTPFPTATPSPTTKPTPSPTVTPSPTPTEVPVYDQIVALEAAMIADSELPVKAALLVNLTDKCVVYSDHATETIYPASITKLMTALIAFSSELDFTQTVEISKNATTPVIPSAKMCGFKSGDRILLRDLVKCMLIYSGNDTSVAVAEHISGSEEEFVALMNQKAEELGLHKTHFCNSHGLPDDNHVTSAYDIYLIMQKLFNFEEFLGIIESGSIEVDVMRREILKSFTFESTNQFFLGTYQLPEGITMLGGKTGTTNKAGCCLTLYVRDQNNNCYIAEIFGAESYDSLYTCMIKLLQKISDK
ncbi:MAG: D-alanyl-D-alanine carboxypeptidase [Lachnospiraceae bacterium]|nr:D-alanyl-D-alanine carboxypeptidase [Lachnospiraceae bacterium]